jgi:hypothetical protein
MEILIEVTAVSAISDISLKDFLPAEMVMRVGTLMVDGVANSGNILEGINLGSFAAGQTKRITFRADLRGSSSFPQFTTTLTNKSEASSTCDVKIAIANVVVHKTVPPSSVPTGLTNNPFLDSFLLPLVFTAAIIWAAKTKLIGFEEWLDKRRTWWRNYHSKRKLDLTISKIKIKEKLNRIL